MSNAEDRPPRAYDVMWREIKAYLKVKSFAQVSWSECARAAAELGYPMHARAWQPGTPGGRPVPRDPSGEFVR